ncbi:acetylornithine deacetylase [Longilinea arvoryzae]|uniref:Acetylornithine deacetylase n=1 Tax=Longilinea arvoryzae TaxID=360412 RepID=A0A0S7BJ21_9CHLR|nr:[LysW]-lysine hydrolase [Longilinea arvoryzae]GAP15757.1 acetylornithine deacetylase [Longilinea arvoryzae]
MSQTLLGLVSHYSPSRQERAACLWLTEHMRSLGYDRAFIDAAGNAVGVLGNGPRQVVLLGHIDTVPGELPVRVEDGVLYGRGAVDAKGPLACFTDAVARVGAVEGWQWVVIGAVDEERDSLGARFAAGQYHPDYAVIGEPNRWERVALGYKGSAGAHLTVRRRQVHSASGEQTACEAAVAAWLAVQAWVETFNIGKTRAFDKIMLSLQGMESGGDGLEQWARLKLGARLPPDLAPQEWYRRLVEIAAGAEIQEAGYAVPAWACEKNSALVRAFLSAIRAQGGAPSFVYKTGTADLNVVAPAWGCPALVYGPGDSALDHTPDECVSLAEFEKAVAVLAAAFQGIAEKG